MINAHSCLSAAAHIIRERDGRCERKGCFCQKESTQIELDPSVQLDFGDSV